MNSSPCKYTVVVQTPPFFECPGCQNLCLVGDVILCGVPIKTEKVNSEVAQNGSESWWPVTKAVCIKDGGGSRK